MGVRDAILTPGMLGCIEAVKQYPEWVGLMQMVAAYDSYPDMLAHLVAARGVAPHVAAYIARTPQVSRNAAARGAATALRRHMVKSE